MTNLVFVYGSLKRPFWNHHYLKNQTFLGEGITVSDSFSMWDGGFPYVGMGGISKIAGEVYEVDDRTIERLDVLEGVPSHYVQTKVDVTLFREDDVRMPGAQEVVECTMYVASHRVHENLTKKVQMSPDHSNVLTWRENASIV